MRHGGEFDAIVVGAGLAGLYMLYRLREIGLSARVLEAGDGVGGTWYWNRYPGACCDGQSVDYSYSFSESLQQEWRWTERYASQPEILDYIEHVADRFDLRKDVQLGARVVSARYDEDADRWEVVTDGAERFSARFCVMATGCLSVAHVPGLDGLDAFEGEWHHTGRWPHEGVDFAGRRVGVIGTGSTGIQIIPKIAEKAERVVVFQRTPNFSIPAHNGPLDPEVERRVKADYAGRRRRARESPGGFPPPEATKEFRRKRTLELAPSERRRGFEAGWEHGGAPFTGTFADMLTDQEANDAAAEFVRSKIRETVRDPDVAEKLSPRDHPVGTKRICVDTDYYETYNRDNVTLIDVRKSPIAGITASGVRLRDGQEHGLDTLVFATGFDAMTGALSRIYIRGRGGLVLGEEWEAGPRTYLGLTVAGFPNLFLVTGPGSPSVLSNMMTAIEQHVEWIADLLEHASASGIARVEATFEAQDRWVQHVDEAANDTLFPTADSWYMGANVAGKPRVFMPYVAGMGVYKQRCDEVSSSGYEGFELVARTAEGLGPRRT